MGVLLKAVAVVLAALSALAFAGTPPSPTPKLLDTGKQVYAVNCVACHGVTGEGNGPVAFAVKPPPRNFVKDPFKAGDTVEQIYMTVTSGLPKTKMVGYPQIKELDRWAVAYYVRSFRIKK